MVFNSWRFVSALVVTVSLNAAWVLCIIVSVLGWVTLPKKNLSFVPLDQYSIPLASFSLSPQRKWRYMNWNDGKTPSCEYNRFQWFFSQKSIVTRRKGVSERKEGGIEWISGFNQAATFSFRVNIEIQDPLLTRLRASIVLCHALIINPEQARW